MHFFSVLSMMLMSFAGRGKSSPFGHHCADCFRLRSRRDCEFATHRLENTLDAKGNNPYAKWFDRLNAAAAVKVATAIQSDGTRQFL